MLLQFLFFAADKICYILYLLFGRKRAQKNFCHNKNILSDNRVNGKFISNQKFFGNIRFGIKNVAYGGCAIVAAHNILTAAQKGKDFPILVRDFEKSALIFGIFGVSPRFLSRYLEKEGFETTKLRGKKFVTDFCPMGQNLIVFYFRKDLSAHYAAGIYTSKNRYVFLNSHTSKPMSYAEYIKSLYEKEKPLYACILTIKTV